MHTWNDLYQAFQQWATMGGPSDGNQLSGACAALYGASATGPQLTPPLAANFAWVNQANATEADDAFGFSIQLPNQGSNNLTHKVVPVTSPYTLTVGFRGLTTNNNFSQCGLSIRNGVAGTSIVFRFRNDGSYDIYTWIDPASFQTQLVSGTLGVSFWGSDLMVARIVVDSSHRTYYVGTKQSIFRGQWVQLFQTANNAYLTEDSCGVFLLASNNNPQIMDVEHFTLTTP